MTVVAAPTFAGSALGSGARWARDFEQRALVRAYPGLRGRPGLCAALVRLWWRALRDGGDLLDALEALGPEREDALAHLALEALAPARLPQDGRCGEGDRRLLELKYGTADPATLRERLREHGCADLRELDLTLHFEARLIARWRPAAWTELVERLLAREPEPVLSIVSVPSPGGRMALSSGHRLSMLWTGSEWRFFDPNHGEAAFPPGATVGDWLERFGRACGHAARVGEPGAGARLWRLAPDARDLHQRP